MAQKDDPDKVLSEKQVLEQRLHSADEQPLTMMEMLSISLPSTVAIPEVYIHGIPYGTHGPPAGDWAHEMC